MKPIILEKKEIIQLLDFNEIINVIEQSFVDFFSKLHRFSRNGFPVFSGSTVPENCLAGPYDQSVLTRIFIPDT